MACGLDDALRYLERLRFDRASLEYLSSLDQFSDRFLDWLSRFRFSGDVYAVPEGTPVYAREPLLEVVAPLPEAQLAKTFIMNQVHFQTVVASKAARIVCAAEGLPATIRSLEDADPPYPVALSDDLHAFRDEVIHEIVR